MTDAQSIWSRDDWRAGQAGHHVLHNQIRNRFAQRRYVTDPDIGAVPDGQTNNTAALQAALDGGGELYFPPGEYRFEALTIPRFTTIRAARGTVLQHMGNNIDPGVLLGSEHVALHDIDIRCVSGESPAGIVSTGAHDVILDNVRVSGNGSPSDPAFRYTEAALLISGGNWHWDVYGGKYEQSQGHCLDLRGGGAVMNFWGVHFSFSGGYGVHQRGKGEGFALQLSGCTVQGSIAGQMYADTLLGAVITNTHFENSSNATCIPLRLGGYADPEQNDPYGGACIGVAITGCNFNAERALYCVDLDSIGANRGITVQSCRLAGQIGYIEAGINAKKASNCMFTANVLFPHAGFPHVKGVGDGYYPHNLFVQDEETCGVQYLS